MSAPCLLAIGLLTVACNRRGGADFERMLDQHKYRAYDENPFFADGLTLRRPPAGTVPHSVEPYFGSTLTGLEGTEYLEQIPIAVDLPLLERGRDRFLIYCATCHGALGDGKSKVAENMVRRPAPSLHEPPISGFRPGRVYRVVREGYGLMPAYGDALDVRERWAVVAYVETLKLSQRVSVRALPRQMLAEAEPWLK